MVDRYAHRYRRVQVDAQDLSYHAKLLFNLGLKPDGVAKATAVLIQIGFVAALGSARLLIRAFGT